MRSHEKLEVWQKAVDFVVMIYKHTEAFPSDERFGLVSQIRRAAVSIPANIAEGAARAYPKDTLRFISMAQGSASEVSTELLISRKLGFLSDESLVKLDSECDEIGRMMSGWANYQRSKL
ncbi:MAG: four helix bundle protein [Acidobacteria bacterium]|nr:four helix bundle protein [Acidobacteriota bacterium]